MGCGNSSFVLVMQEPPKKHDDVPTKEMFVINRYILIKTFSTAYIFNTYF